MSLGFMSSRLKYYVADVFRGHFYSTFSLQDWIFGRLLGNFLAIPLEVNSRAIQLKRQSQRSPSSISLWLLPFALKAS